MKDCSIQYNHSDDGWQGSCTFSGLYDLHEAIALITERRSAYLPPQRDNYRVVRGTTIVWPVPDSMLTGVPIEVTEDPTVDNRPPVTHYSQLIPEPIDVIDGWKLNYYKGQVIKYLARAGNKEGESELTDLRKARDYLNRNIAILEGRTNSWN